MMTSRRIRGENCEGVTAGFAPADNPEIMALAIIDNPQGTYYGGQIAAPVIRQLFENILPYLEISDYK